MAERKGEKQGRKGKRGEMFCLFRCSGWYFNQHPNTMGTHDIRRCEPVSQCRSKGVGSALAHHRFTN